MPLRNPPECEQKKPTPLNLFSFILSQTLLKLDTLGPVALSKRLKVMKMERSFTREGIFTLDAETTANFRDKVCSLQLSICFIRLCSIDELFEESNNPEYQTRMILEGSAYYDVEDKVCLRFNSITPLLIKSTSSAS
ncbi:unnamed protein product [Nippostrongylus brasiliensis]|uniref:Uncharacterized protein n=1 Tax=Nippostrongylus brasiliensis TaxID=27835 RepID=A0A0N4YXB7_NIPBR|nr:unnamed protein product [Nippostrongylus brasiliensis]